MPRRLGIDMRATRTDVLLYDEQTGASDILKIAMDPADPGSALTQGLEALVRMAGISAGDIDHAAVSLPPEVFDNPARTGLLVTQGFEQSLPHRAGADAALARGVPERCLANGNVSHELDEEAAERSIRQLLGQGINALAICLMHAPRNPAHEVRLEEIALACDASLRVALSHRVAHGGGEAARARAVLLAAGTSASVDACLSAVEAGLSGAQMSPSLRVVQSTGDCLDRAAAVQQRARLPAAGAASAVAAAAKAAAAAGHQKAVSLNIGSTAATGALIRQGRARIADATVVGGGDGTVPLPSVDLRDIGSGLNAVASAPFPGMVRVGPAHARPACQGGEAATVMDALAVLKRLPLAALSLDGTAAESAVAKVAAAMGAGLHETAAAIVGVYAEDLAGHLLAMVIEKGESTDGLALVAGGGGGALFGGEVGAVLGATVVVPAGSGALSALGCALSDHAAQFSEPFAPSTAPGGSQRFAETVARLRAAAEASAKVWAGGDATITYRADVRCAGERFRSSVALTIGTDGGAMLQTVLSAAAEGYQRRYGRAPDAPLEITAVRAEARAASASAIAHRTGRSGGGREEDAQIWFDGGFQTARVHDGVGDGTRIAGPAMVVQKDATVIIGPGHAADVDGFGNIIFGDGLRGARP